MARGKVIEKYKFDVRLATGEVVRDLIVPIRMDPGRDGHRSVFIVEATYLEHRHHDIDESIDELKKRLKAWFSSVMGFQWRDMYLLKIGDPRRGNSVGLELEVQKYQIATFDPTGKHRGEIFAGAISALCNMQVEVVAIGLGSEMGRSLTEDEVKRFMSIASPKYTEALEFVGNCSNALFHEFAPIIEDIRDKHQRRGSPSKN